MRSHMYSPTVFWRRPYSATQKNYVHYLHFTVFCGSVVDDFTHILHGCFIGMRVILPLPSCTVTFMTVGQYRSIAIFQCCFTGIWVLTRQPQKLWVNKSPYNGIKTYHHNNPVKTFLRDKQQTRDDVIKSKHVLRYMPFVPGIHRWPVTSPSKGQWRGALIFSLICAWINGWVNNREAGDLRRHQAHCDVIVRSLPVWRPCRPRWVLCLLGRSRA